MPIYEYACRKCGKTFEYMQRMSDPPKRTCEACGSQALERLISHTSFQLKGSGWYKDLYASPKPAAASKSDGASDSGSGSAAAPGSGSGSGSGSAASSPSGSATDKSSGSGSGSDKDKGGKKTGKKSRKGPG